MKSIKRILVSLIALAMVASCIIIPASAGSTEYNTCAYVGSKGATIDIWPAVPENEITKVIVNGTEVTKGTDYTVEVTSTDTYIVFTEAYMGKTLTKDWDNMEVYISGECLDVYNDVDCEDWGGEIIVASWTLDEYKEDDVDYLMELFVEKGILTKTTEGGKTIYKDGDKTLLTVDDTWATPITGKVLDNIYTFEPTLSETYTCYKDIDRFEYDGTILVAFGNDMAIDLTDLEPGVAKTYTYEEGKEYMDIEMMFVSVELLLDEGLVTLEIDEESSEHVFGGTIYDESGEKALVHFVMDEENGTIDVTVLPGVNSEDSILYNDDELVETVEKDGEYVIVGIKFGDPKIKSGDNQTYDKAKGGDLVVSSTAAFDDFQKVLVDGKEISKDNYTAVKGSTVVTLKESYLKTLKAGKHTLSIVSTTGTVTATFTVNDGETIANTGDNTAIGAFVALSAFAAVGFVSLKKKED